MKKKEIKWTLFWDMHSGGGTKEKPYEMIYIEAPEEEAKIIFYNRFGHNPERVSCTCCGQDYSISESETLEQASAYHRGCAYAYFKGDKRITREEGFISGNGSPKGVIGKYIEEGATELYSKQYITLSEYAKHKDVLVVCDKDIKPEERIGEAPVEGYVWM